jgi:eukaryotic-like serine/threonine-protein kinase
LIVANADRIIELLHEAKAQPAGAERARFLDEACRDDAGLKEQIVSLLEADADEGGSDFLKIKGILRPPIPPTEKPGDRIGRYKLLEQIGEGGCGVVYMAEQAEPVRRRVALKVIKLGMDTKQVLARFEAERQALAMMDHPNIAKVLDAGATDTGRPFFVMELVRGVKITDFCDQNNLTTSERLELFIQVCQAIQHAHQKGIIHRDIKPSNILVTLHDDVAVPKVIDFGIAKATVGQLTDKTVFTAFAQFIGTPAYMSPEQAQMSGLDIDTRADIYSLGVLLYELLTGNTPFDAKDLLAAGMDEMRRKIREDEPAKPSTCLSTMQAMDLTTAARRRQVEPPKLIYLIRGDLDWLVMKCLEKDRTRRYETANGLAADIQRHLSNEPITARPPSRWYEFQKTVRRHKFGFATAAALILVLGLGVLVSAWQAVRAMRAEREQSRLRQQAEANEKRAEAESFKSQQVAQFMKDMLKGVGPATAMGRDTTMLREILDKTATRLNGLKSQPTVEADLLATLGNVYADLGEYTNAVAMHRESLALRRKLWGNEHREVANGLYDFAVVLYAPGRFTEAEALCREAVAIRRKLPGPEHVDIATALDCLARILEAQGRLDEAVTTWQEALAMRRKLRGNDHESVGYVLHPLAWTLGRQRKYSEAEAMSREELAIWRKRLGADHSNVGWALGDLAIYLREQGKLAESEATVREALEISRKQSGNNPAAVATFLRQLAWVVYHQGKRAEAEAISREELALRRKVLGINHPEVAATLYCLATFLRDQKKWPEGETTIREALKIRRMQLGDGHADVAASCELLSELLQAQGKTEEANATAAAALAIRQKLQGDGHPEAAKATYERAVLLQKEGNLAEAEPLFREASAAFEELARKNPQRTDHRVQLGHSQWQLGQLLSASGRLEDAERVFNEALLVFEQAARDFPADGFLRQEQAFTHRFLGGVATARKQSETAERHYLAAITLYSALIAGAPTNAIYTQEHNHAVASLLLAYESTGQSDKVAEWQKQLIAPSKADR